VCVQVEEGGKVDRLERPLQVGDEIIAINEVELSGYRQEAIALVKASHKTLQLTVRSLMPFQVESQNKAQGAGSVEPAAALKGLLKARLRVRVLCSVGEQEELIINY
ncbi:unnamed protein product, partial [Tetraodon nigroviridis]